MPSAYDSGTHRRLDTTNRILMDILAELKKMNKEPIDAEEDIEEQYDS
jgi:hypothetical protein